MGVADFTLADMVRGGARSFGRRTWLVTQDGRLTHQDCLDRMEATARRLAGAGVGRGDRVALLAQNRPEHLDFLFAAARLGAILVEVNWRLSADEVAHVLRDTTPKVVVSEPAYAETLAGLRPSLAIEHWWSLDEAGAGLESWASCAEAPCPESEVSADDAVLIIHTAAVAGQARGAVLSHRNLVAANMQLLAAWALTPGDVGLVLLPLFHISGSARSWPCRRGGRERCPAPLRAGGGLRRHRTGARDIVLRVRPDAGPDPRQARRAGHDLSSLRAVGASTRPRRLPGSKRLAPASRFFVGYGQSETSGLVTLGPARERSGTAGRSDASGGYDAPRRGGPARRSG
jgi:long-chain acyl-CoA synthetase